MKILAIVAVLAAGCMYPAYASAASIEIAPLNIIQGEAIQISIKGAGPVASVSFAGTPLRTFQRNGDSLALYGFDLNKKPGDYTVYVVLADGTKLEKTISVLARPKKEAPLGIPVKLGGNTAASQAALVNSLLLENQRLLNIRTGAKAFWSEPFRYPVKAPIITDSYGYTRITGEYGIAHKGTDFRAKEGTPVLAMNRGVVRQVTTYRNYGKTIVVDHGLGLQTFYMHLSKIKVNVGQLVLPGETIGYSGSTGYADAAHLHLTMRLNDVSIDPIRFIELFEK